MLGTSQMPKLSIFSEFDRIIGYSMYKDIRM